MGSHRTAMLAVLCCIGCVLAACSNTTNGTGAASSPATSAASSHLFPSSRATSAASTAAAGPSTQPNGSTIVPAPPTPLRTVVVHATDGATYVIKIWAQVQDATCFDHAYGQVQTFLAEHPCRGLTRLLATTAVDGRPVGFAESSTSIPGTGRDIYGNAARLRQLELADGTGSIDDLLRDGYRLPTGPTSVPTPDAFNCLGQDTGVTVWDAWYLDGPTPANDPALVKMTEDIFLQF